MQSLGTNYPAHFRTRTRAEAWRGGTERHGSTVGAAGQGCTRTPRVCAGRLGPYRRQPEINGLTARPGRAFLAGGAGAEPAGGVWPLPREHLCSDGKHKRMCLGVSQAARARSCYLLNTWGPLGGDDSLLGREYF